MRWAIKDPELGKMADHWAQTIQNGDVVRTPSGDLRVVRSVHRCGPKTGKGAWGSTLARRVYCHFAIRHCSWTGRPYTNYNVAEMVQMGWVPTAAKPRALRSDIDKALEHDFGANRTEDCILTCCAVRGLP